MVLSKYRPQASKEIPFDDAVEALIEPVDPARVGEYAEARRGEGDFPPAAARVSLVPPVWIDMVSPTAAEIAEVEQSLALEIPTRAEMEEIELSSRLYEENDALFMTAPVLHGAASDMPETTAVTFILTRSALVTLRYANPLPLQAFTRRAERLPLLIANKVTFLLDATLGLINIEQNNIVKIFTVASVAFLPPTLIASIYGMNFKLLPELDWEFGYPFAIALMILSAVLPFWYFRRRGWL